MQLQMSGYGGLRLRSIIIHSLWITVIGLLLFRLATANTQEVIYIEIFSISGVILATSPWIIQLLVATTIIVLYRTKCCDLTWLVTLPSEEGSCSQGSSADDEGVGNKLLIANLYAGRIVEGNGWRKVRNGSGMSWLTDGRNGHGLKRCRTI